MKKVSIVLVLGGLLSTVTMVMAANFPWDGPLSKLSQNLTGTTSTAIAMIGLFVAGGALVFGGDLGDFAKRVTWMTLAISLMLSGGAFVNMLSNGAALPVATAIL